MKKVTEYIKPIIALVVLIFGFSFILATTFMGYKNNDSFIAVYALMVTVVNYYLGNATGQTKKDETINNLIDKQK